MASSSSSSSETQSNKSVDGVFQMFDRDGDGRITKAEMSEFFKCVGMRMPEAEVVQMMMAVDEDGDGCLNRQEFGNLYRAVMEEEEEGEEEEKDEEEGDMMEAFRVFDQNGDGFITADELCSVLSSLGLRQGKSTEDCRQMITMVDVNGDGMVNFTEFKQMMRRDAGLQCFTC